MKKITILLSFALLFGAFNMNAQETKTVKKNTSQVTNQWNFGFLGANYEFPLGKNISIAPFAATDWDFEWLTLGAKGNFYFDNLLNLPAAWDVYGGANIGFGIGIGNNAESDLNLGAHAGGRWFWSDNWGVYAEFSGGSNGAIPGIGLTWKK